MFFFTIEWKLNNEFRFNCSCFVCLNIFSFHSFITILRFGRRLEIDSRTLEDPLSNIKFRLQSILYWWGNVFLNAAVYCIRKTVIMACTLYVIWKSRLILLNNNTLRSGYGGYVILAVISGIVHYRLHLNRGVCGTVRDFLLCCHRHR